MTPIANQKGPKSPLPKGKSYTLNDVYLFFRGRHYTLWKEKEISEAMFRDICETANVFIIEALYKEALELRLPASLGVMSLISVKTDPENAAIDWKATKEAGTVVKHFNEHSRGRHFKIYWRKGRTTNISVYRFDITRHNKRYLATCAKSNEVNANPSPF